MVCRSTKRGLAAADRVAGRDARRPSPRAARARTRGRRAAPARNGDLGRAGVGEDRRQPALAQDVERRRRAPSPDRLDWSSHSSLYEALPGRRGLMSTRGRGKSGGREPPRRREDLAGRIFSDGWVDAPETIESTEPATGEVLGTAGAGNADAVAQRRRVGGASPARVGRHPVHRARRGGAPRGRAARAPPRGADRLARARGSGAIPPKADNEISASIGQFEMAAALISHPLGQVLPSMTPGRTSMARRVPVGVVGVICPWNFPVVLPARSVGPALALGQRRGPQVGPEHAGQRRRADRAHLRGGRPARGRAARAGRRRRGGPGAGARTRTCG